MISLMLLSLRFTKKSSWMFLLARDLFTLTHWLLLAMELLLLLLIANVNIMCATVKIRALLTANATATFPSLIATSDGIHPGPVFIMDTIYICWLLLIRKATFLFSLC